MGGKSWRHGLEQNQINMKQIKHLILIVLVSVTGIVKAQKQTDRNELAEFAVRSKVAHAQVVDARTQEEFIQNHIEGAVNIDPASAAYAKKVAGLAKDRPVFVYSIANGRSVAVAKELRARGFKEVNVLPGGIANWIGSGYPIISNTKKGVALSLAQFNTLTASSGLVLVDFGSKYCGACKKLIPVLDSLESKQGFTAKVIRIEAYDNTGLIKELKVNQLPTLVLYQGGKQVWKKAGLSSTAEIEKIVNTKRHE
jgi:rhodanese-related sulfurtransferase